MADGFTKTLHKIYTVLETSGLKLPPSKIVTPSITVATDAYTAEDCVGGKLTLTDAMRVENGTGILNELVIIDKSGTQKPQLEIFIFDSDPTAAATGYTPSVLTDEAALDFNDGITKLIGSQTVYPSDYVLTDGIYIANLKNLGMIVEASGSDNLFAAVKCIGVPDFVASTDLIIRFKFMRD